MEGLKHCIVFAGGGTLGPVVPLLAVQDAYKERVEAARFHWIGTPQGPERALIVATGAAFHALSAPKLDRTRTYLWPFIAPHLVLATAQAIKLLKDIRPERVFVAGGYVGIPVVYAAKMLGIPVWVHQLDALPLLANKVVAPFAEHISVTWDETRQHFKRRTEHVGALIRKPQVERGTFAFMQEKHLDPKKPTVFFFGGGTGAVQINTMLASILPDLLKEVNVLHLSGKGKKPENLRSTDGYAVEELLDGEMARWYAAADIVVCRAGMGTLMELGGYGKPAILMPLSGHQEENARLYEKRGAAIRLTHVNPQVMKQEVLKLANDRSTQAKMESAARIVFEQGGAEKILDMIGLAKT